MDHLFSGVNTRCILPRENAFKSLSLNVHYRLNGGLFNGRKYEINVSNAASEIVC
jgi:hypothetical protein